MKFNLFGWTLMLFLIASTDIFAQPIDSLLTICQETFSPPDDRLDALQELLFDRKYYRVDLNASDKLSQEQLDLARLHGDKIDLANAMINRAYMLCVGKLYPEAQEFTDELFSLDIDLLPDTQKARAYNVHGLILYGSGNVEEARLLFDKILTLDKPPINQQYNAYKYISICLLRTGDLIAALETLNKSYAFIENEEDRDYDKSVHFNNKMVALYRMGDLDESLKNIHKAIYYQKKTKSEKGLISKTNNLASLYQEMGQFEKAKFYVDTSLILAEKYNDESYKFLLKVTSAEIYVDQDSLNKAGDIFSSVEKQIENIKKTEIKGYYYFALGKYQMMTQAYDKAYASCEKGYDIFTEIKFLSRREMCAKCLYDISELTSEPKNALKWHLKYRSIKDSLINTKTIVKIAQIEQQQKHKEEIIHIENKAKNEKKNKTILLIILLAISIIALALLWIYNIEKKKSSLLQIQNNLLEENLEKKTLIEKQVQQLQEQEQEKSNFLANIAHELQTPLMVISGQSNELLANEKISLKDKLTISTIAKNSTNLSSLTKQIIETSKNKSWTIELDLKKFYLYEILNPIVAEYNVLAREKDIQIDLNYNGTQEVFLVTDADKMRVIISNIIINSIRYGKIGGQVSIDCSEVEGEIAIDIEDNGIGISKNDLLHIFDRFYQTAQPSNSLEQKGGFGIGLSVCKQYTELLGGRIKAVSTLETGSTFYVSLPQQLAKPAITQERLIEYIPDALLADIPNKVYISEGAPTILIVEDNKDIWLYLQNLLGQQYNLQFSANGSEALNYLENNPSPNLIITDLMMPKMDGLTLIESLKSKKGFSVIPILVITARNDIGNKIKGLSFHIDDYILKPFNNEFFIARVTYILNLSKERLEDIIGQKKTEVYLTIKEQEWLSEIENFVRNSLPDTNLSPRNIADHMKLSQVHLDRKLKSLISFTTSKYLLEARLRVALELIEKKECSLVKEVCYKVGFKSPKSFARSFKQRFGAYPSDLMN